MYGGPGNGLLIDYYGDNLLRGGAGPDDISGSSVEAGFLGCFLELGGGADRIYGDAGDDTLYGHYGDDTIHGGPGTDEISASYGNDTIYADDGEPDVIRCGEGQDTVFHNEDTVTACIVLNAPRP